MDPRDTTVDVIQAVADWAIHHGFRDIGEAAVKRLQDMNVALLPGTLLRMELKNLCSAAEDLQQENLEGLKSLLRDTLATEVMVEAAHGEAYEWFQIVRRLAQQGVVAILAQTFLPDAVQDPTSPDDIVVPKKLNLDILSAEIDAFFDENSAVYVNHDQELEVDRRYFSATGFCRLGAAPATSRASKKSGAKAAPVPTLVPDKIVLFDIFEKYSLTSYKQQYVRYFSTLERVLCDSVNLKVLAATSTNLAEEVGEKEWTAADANERGPYSGDGHQAYLSPKPSSSQAQARGAPSSPPASRSAHRPEVPIAATPQSARAPTSAATKSTKPTALVLAQKVAGHKATSAPTPTPAPYDALSDTAPTEAQSSSPYRKAVKRRTAKAATKKGKKTLTGGRPSGEKIAFADGLEEKVADSTEEEEEEETSPPPQSNLVVVKHAKKRQVAQILIKSEPPGSQVPAESSDSGPVPPPKIKRARMLESDSSGEEVDEEVDAIEEFDEQPSSALQLLKQVSTVALRRPQAFLSAALGGTATDPSSPRADRDSRIKWRFEEEEALARGVAKYGRGNWKDILEDDEFGPVLSHRTNVDLKDKFRNMVRKK